MKIHHCDEKISLWQRMKNWRGLWFHLAGLIAIIWFLVRVIPNPTRARYPCQQVAISVAIGYIAFWGVLFSGLFVWIRNVKTKWAKTVPALFTVFIILFTISGVVFATFPFQSNQTSLSSWDPISIQPIGIPTGASPGRVVWAWNPHATQRNLQGFWWQSHNNNQTVIDQMLSDGIRQYAGVTDDAEAWDVIFTYFNVEKGFGEAGYEPGEKIVIKLNMNNAYVLFGNPYIRRTNDRDASPHLVKALLRQLVYVVGVSQEDITLFDASRPIPNWFYNRIRYETYPSFPLVDEFPDVNFVDSTGGASRREKATASNEKIHFADGLIRTLPTCVVEAKYFINIPLLKRHPISMGVTFSGKNHFGSFMERVADLHPYHESGLIMGNPAPQVDLLAHEHLGGKTLLYIGDALYGTKIDHKTIARFLMYPFNDDWTNSLFISQDPVALDSVMYDFLYAEGTNPSEGSQNYLHQAAEPQLNVYDPENNGVFLSESLGVHEHWDASVDIFSSQRYLGLEGDGIDFQTSGEQYASPGIVISNPLENHGYVRGDTIGWFPFTLIIGNIDVEAQIRGNVQTVEKVEFYQNNKLQHIETEAPYIWSWDVPSFFRQTIKIVAYYDSTESMSNEIRLWKFF
ncbi:MAG: DUF362 domain-containing protein [Thermoplasmatota archaeon]